MDRLFDFLRDRLTLLPGVTDRSLLDHFLATRDEAAFTELVRRYAPLVWGVCRRRFTSHDAEDAFQATFLVLLRRAARLGADVPLGPWLYQVAVMTARNIVRGNRRRAAVSESLEHDVAIPLASSSVECLDLDAALLTLPERDREAIVLCHLQGLSRREAASRLGCPEGTLSARLSRALDRLRAKLGDVPTVLATAGAIALPSGLSATMVRVGMIYTTSNLTAAGMSPAVVEITERVLRMFWMKKLTMGLALAAIVAAGLSVGLAVNTGNFAHATDPVPSMSLVGDSSALPEDPEVAKRAVEVRLKELTKKAAEIERAIAATKAEKTKLEEAQKAKARATELDGALDIDCQPTQYIVREVIHGKVVEVYCHDLDMLSTYLMRVFNDAKGPKKLRIHTENAATTKPIVGTNLQDSNLSSDRLAALVAAAARAGFTKATFFQHALQYPFPTTQPNMLQGLGEGYLLMSSFTQPDPRFLQSYQIYGPGQLNPTMPGSIDGVLQTEIDLTKLVPPKKK